MTARKKRSEQKQKDIQILELFNNKVDKLMNLSFTEYVSEHNTGFKLKLKEGKTPSINEIFPDEESFDAFVPTFRMFLQKKERISIYKIESIYERNQLSKELKAKFKESKEKYEEFLDKKSMIEGYTRREFTFILIYGNYLHLDEKKRAVYEKYVLHPIGRAFAVNEFLYTLSKSLTFFRYVYFLNEEALKKLR
ncbi:MAG: hypothetical protein H7644_04935 [Candidatus Heimdallarchaeota archaeon]|nr:hypothetical protein [Candidatus Heimdallarchaeota archaeon]MCK5143090.1 hypothetical protein [Candidatus Heimdallarchaeota archaeon]